MKFLHASLFLIFATIAASGEIRVGGSDLLAPKLSTALSEYAEARELDVSVDFGGSYRAVEQVRDGELDLAIVAIPDGHDLPDEALHSAALAFQVVVVGIPPSNPINQLTLRQLGAIFGEAEATHITRWGQLGLTGEWESRSITPGAISPLRHSLALDLFRYIVLQSRNLRRSLTHFETIDEIRRRFQQENAGIALLHRLPANTEDLKLLAIARTGEDLAHAPSPQNVASGDYPLRLPLYLVFQPERGSDLKDILLFLTSQEVSEAIEESSLLPLPDRQRQRLFFEFERF